MSSIVTRLQEVKQRIEAASLRAGRDANKITLLVVSKSHPVDAVRAAHAAGARAFGENYVQEALGKLASLADGLRPPPEWHLIGPLQSNKAGEVAGHFQWVHTVDRLKLAERLAARRPDGLPPVQLCLQVNISAEPSKHGVAPADACALARAVAALPADRVRLRGLMTIPAPAAGFEAQRGPHRRLRELMQAINAEAGLALDTLSIGMSDDLEAAIAEGATIVRVGSAIFGPRG